MRARGPRKTKACKPRSSKKTRRVQKQVQSGQGPKEEEMQSADPSSAEPSSAEPSFDKPSFDKSSFDKASFDKPSTKRRRTAAKPSAKRHRPEMDAAASASAQDVFVFYSSSADKPPGRGVHEQGNPANYKELDRIPDWRKKLSNFDTGTTPFVWTGNDVLQDPFPDGTAWRSIEHVFQGTKFKVTAPFVDPSQPRGNKKPRSYTPQDDLDAAMRFTVNSGDSIGAGEGADAQHNRKLMWLNKEDFPRWDELSSAVMASAAKAKYAQDEDRMHMLRATAPAQLIHMVKQRGKLSSFVHFKHLEDIRDRSTA